MKLGIAILLLEFAASSLANSCGDLCTKVVNEQCPLVPTKGSNGNNPQQQCFSNGRKLCQQYQRGSQSCGKPSDCFNFCNDRVIKPQCSSAPLQSPGGFNVQELCLKRGKKICASNCQCKCPYNAGSKCKTKDNAVFIFQKFSHAYSWNGAQQYCRRTYPGSDLPSFHSQAEWNFFLANKHAMGVEPGHYPQSLPLGGKKTYYGSPTFAWEDGSEFDWNLPWGSKRPDTAYEDALELHAWAGNPQLLLNDLPSYLGNRYPGFACRIC
eukprot:TRINITY_DN108_c0_g1_i5.p1 TRINITY_DN108_c0_g1~~TRINITY_DN108_c0_g1_i5.p1  ORF type:complete len:267 (+),score=30.95 TRINITY_DN108_c0_g1_i5:31-831(+)